MIDGRRQRRLWRRVAQLIAGFLGANALVVAWLSVCGAQPLVADLSRHLVAITTGFTGAEVVLFGATDGAGDVAVVVTGPRSGVTVRRKNRVAGIWVNTLGLHFDPVPAFYAVATSKPLETFVNPSVLERHQIGLEHLRLEPVEPVARDKAVEFRDALIRNMQRQKLYGSSLGQVAFLGDKLFRTSLLFPANVPTGLYTVGVFLITNGNVVSAQTTPLAVSKIGVSDEIFEFSQRQPLLYGVLAVIGAVFAGWLAGTLLRKS
ncbi:MAG: hypothetical protein GC191_07080 [Azospirillum sp.]|nr:hypothetical protein [Azospirillum sp.]